MTLVLIGYVLLRRIRTRSGSLLPASDDDAVPSRRHARPPGADDHDATPRRLRPPGRL
ncbi:hypothetical protein [Streptomyces coeruleorubidus]|uniref:hypothetical protein n=1 Tax=Streptomyces coeruleorubidus TaxID=116188 RepID=UPI0034013273